MVNKRKYYTRKELEENSLSRRDGISLKEENELSKKCIDFMVENSKKFGSHLIVAKANVYYHRFFLLRSHAKHQWYRIAIACMFLASKVEKRQFSLDDFRQEGWKNFLKEVFKKEIPLKELKKMILDDELEILRTINFDVYVDLPYFYLGKFASEFKDIPTEVTQTGVKFISKIYFSSLCLQFEPQKIAGAAFYLAYKFLNLKLPFQEEEEGYREFFQMTLKELEGISIQMMNLSLFSGSLPIDQSLSAYIYTDMRGLRTNSNDVVCPKPRRMFYEVSESKAGKELLDISLRKGEYGVEKPNFLVDSSPPFFSGSPPRRPSNPIIQDQQFGKSTLSPQLGSRPVDQSLSALVPSPLPISKGNQRPLPRTAQKMEEWRRYYTRKELEENSPSRRDGISLEEENEFNIKSIHFMFENSKKFGSPFIVAKANAFYHRFFMLRSHAKHRWYRIAIACLILASKADEHEFSLDNFGQKGWRKPLKEIFEKEIPLKELKKMILDDESEILRATNFEFNVDLPFIYFHKVANKFKDEPTEVKQTGLKFIIKTYYSSLCLQFEPWKIAGAAFHLAYKFLNLKLPFLEEEGYRQLFQMTLNELEDVSKQILDLFGKSFKLN